MCDLDKSIEFQNHKEKSLEDKERWQIHAQNLCQAFAKVLQSQSTKQALQRSLAIDSLCIRSLETSSAKPKCLK